MRRVLMVGLLALGGFAAGAGFAQSNNDRGPAITSGIGGGASPNIVIGSGTLNSNSPTTSPERVFRDGSPSTCGPTKAFPGTVPGGPFAYTTVSYTNTGPGRCVNFTLNASCVNGNTAGLFLVAYAGAINPANLSQNYIGDSGVSTGTGFPPTQMAVQLGANQSINLMIEQVNPAGTTPPSQCSFTLLDDTQIVVPTMSPALMAAMAGILALLGFVYLRRRGGQR